ncbi:helix-turn-helix domain-containing protein [Anaerocolumna chitinilytica]|uniref:Transcriptional regulator n=1 Tax=Anaerocolumna chitinilytica TaxID=1727145 RepID=A0A7I8DJ68_9FIRM|nr:helix-turn-helix domain-containing protein [Anaerocolumna chitinilytica]BCJ98479.1 transcriptional regulator [Anaerocolumna chitinilytica]
MPKQAYSVLTDYLKQISYEFGIAICINDFSGFLFHDRELTELLQPFMIHGNPYCMMIKSDKALWDKCQSMKKPIAEKCRVQKGTFYGMCHAGVEEYIVPITCNGQLIGTINAGVFCSHTKVGERFVKRISQSSALNETALLKLYYSSLNMKIPGIEKINSLLGIAAEYIARIYSDISLSHPDVLNNLRYNSSEDNILGHTLAFVKKNYKNQISVQDIAHSCHCSESYINHTFKKKMQINVKSYINQLRVEDAKTYLSGTDLPVKTIASFLGFNDSNYFCKVFSEICGEPPTQFRKNK